MDQKLINKVISITSMETKAGQYGAMAKIKDEKNLTYAVFEQKKDGTTSVTWEQLQGLKIGYNVQISFSEEIKEYEGKPYTARTIRSFNEDIGNGAVPITRLSKKVLVAGHIMRLRGLLMMTSGRRKHISNVFGHTG